MSTTPVLYAEARRRIRLPIASVSFLCLLGLSLGMLVSRHESIAAVASDYVCSQMVVLILGGLYNLCVLQKINALYEELVAYRRQMDEIKLKR